MLQRVDIKICEFKNWEEEEEIKEQKHAQKLDEV